MSIPLVLDVDTGVDDAAAIALATRLSRLQLTAVTTVAGNVPVESSTDNSLRVLEWLGVDVPVYRGMSTPLVRQLWTAREHHGQTGLGNWEPPAARRGAAEQTAPEAIVRYARDHRGRLVLACVGPLTNLAVALALEPRIVDWVDRLVIMGGAFFARGNMTEHAEFNIYVDPEAAASVARAGFNATWVGLDATRQTLLTAEQWATLADSDDRGEQLLHAVMSRTFTEVGRPSFPLHDPLAVAIAEDAEVATMRRGAVRVSTDDGYRGETRLATGTASDVLASVADVVDLERFFGLFSRLSPRMG